MEIWKVKNSFVKILKEMDTILNLNAIKKKMRTKPKGQRLYAFFDASPLSLTARQVDDVEKIVDKGYKEAKQYLLAAKKKHEIHERLTKEIAK